MSLIHDQQRRCSWWIKIVFFFCLLFFQYLYSRWVFATRDRRRTSRYIKYIPIDRYDRDIVYDFVYREWASKYIREPFAADRRARATHADKCRWKAARTFSLCLCLSSDRACVLPFIVCVFFFCPPPNRLQILWTYFDWRSYCALVMCIYQPLVWIISITRIHVNTLLVQLPLFKYFVYKIPTRADYKYAVGKWKVNCCHLLVSPSKTRPSYIYYKASACRWLSSAIWTVQIITCRNVYSDANDRQIDTSRAADCFFNFFARIQRFCNSARFICGSLGIAMRLFLYAFLSLSTALPTISIRSMDNYRWIKFACA